jgi:hypothetical protein|tara:strand:- start:989 stop:1378 length:390 start_codon:yes stop_codon:yes gene_type:complete
MCSKYIKPCLYVAGSILGIIASIKIIIKWDRRKESFSDSKSNRDKVKDDESVVSDSSSSTEEVVIVESDLSSRSGHTIKTKFERKVMKLSHMKKQDLIDECTRRNIACIGTVRVLRERLRIAREDEKKA